MGAPGALPEKRGAERPAEVLARWEREHGEGAEKISLEREEQREVEDVYDTLKAAGGEAGHGGGGPGRARGNGCVSCGG